ncbi:MAG: hypothetical protein M1834_007750 [Cirrosporium novae-zelandiae]|nr:MAG: hypothetical protein M1834_007750 [Cirrosporium novae-zelandiae]
MVAFPYKRVLVLGATSGIGLALAERLIKEGSSVIACGRRQENLDEFVDKHNDDKNKDKANAIRFDVTQLDQIPKFVEDVTCRFPDLDCVVLNSGIQRQFDFTKPGEVDLELMGTEMLTNYTAHVTLTNVTSNLALIPLPRCLNYCASKAALHQFILSLRQQLQKTNIKIIELLPPAVQTELHDEKHQPQIKNGREIGMPLAEFLEEAYSALARGEMEIAVGEAREGQEALEPERRRLMREMMGLRMGGGWVDY